MNELFLVEAKEAEGVSAGHGLRTVGWARKGAVIAFLAVASQPFGLLGFLISYARTTRVRLIGRAEG